MKIHTQKILIWIPIIHCIFFFTWFAYCIKHSLPLKKLFNIVIALLPILTLFYLLQLFFESLEFTPFFYTALNFILVYLSFLLIGIFVIMNQEKFEAEKKESASQMLFDANPFHMEDGKLLVSSQFNSHFQSQRILRWIPVAQMICLFQWCAFYLKNDLPVSYLLKFILKSSICVLLIHIPRVLVYSFFELGPLLHQLFLYTSLYLTLLIIAVFAVAEQKNFLLHISEAKNNQLS